MTMALDSGFYELGPLHLLVVQQWYCQQFAWIILLGGGCAVLCKMLSSIPMSLSGKSDVATPHIYTMRVSPQTWPDIFCRTNWPLVKLCWHVLCL